MWVTRVEFGIEAAVRFCQGRQGESVLKKVRPLDREKIVMLSRRK
jgi:hypothetical protein